jgi:hypothetical protein
MLLDLGMALIIKAVVVPGETWEYWLEIWVFSVISLNLNESSLAWLAKTSLTSVGVVIGILIGSNVLMQGIKYVVIIPWETMRESWFWSIWDRISGLFLRFQFVSITQGRVTK